MVRKFPAIYLLPVIITGIVFADLSRLPAWIFFALLFISLGLGIYFYNHKNKKATVLLLSVALLFFCSFHFAIRYYDNGRTHLSNFIDGKLKYKIYGKISDWPNLKLNQTEIKVSVDSIKQSKSIPVYGNILLKITDTTTSFQRGDKINFSGRIYPVRHKGLTSSFDYQRYLNLKDIFGVLYLPTPLEIVVIKSSRFSIFRFTEQLRNRIRESFYTNLSNKSASLASGFLIGETRDIDPEIYKWFKNSGTLHLLAVSGSNVGLIILFFIILLRPFSLSRTKRAIILLVVIIIFNLLSYGEPSVMRASIMAILVLIGSMIERRYNLNQIIAVTACIILLFEPAQLYDVGFQLSFVIAWGLIYTVPKISFYFAGFETRRWYKWLIYPLIITLIAQIYSVGLVGLYFNQIPVLSPVANLVIVPLVSLAVIGILFLLLLNLILPILALWFGGVLDLLFLAVLYFVDLFGNQKTVLLKVHNWTILWVTAFYFLLFLFVNTLNNKKARRILVISSIILLNLFLIDKFILSNNQTANQVSMFSIPGGIVSLIDYKSSSDLIITGINNRDYKIEEKIIYPKLEELEVKNIKRLFVLSADYSAIDDLIRLISNYKIDSVYLDDGILNSFKDNLQREVANNFINLMSLGTFSDNISQPGIFSINDGIKVIFDENKEVVFLNRLSSHVLKRKTDSDISFLVIGQSWNVRWQELHNLNNNGYDKIIIVSKIPTSNIQSKEQQSLTSETIAGLLIDLKSVQIYQF
jgi:competence protein ComEC